MVALPVSISDPPSIMCSCILHDCMVAAWSSADLARARPRQASARHRERKLQHLRAASVSDLRTPPSPHSRRSLPRFHISHARENNIFRSGFSSKHCRQCNKCCEGFDHHCDIFNNCIGKVSPRNNKCCFRHDLPLLSKHKKTMKCNFPRFLVT